MSELGVEKAANSFEARYVRSTNQFAMITFVVVLGLDFQNYFTRGFHPQFLGELVALFTLCLPTLYWNHRGLFNVAKVSLFLAIVSATFATISATGRLEGHQLYYLLIALGFPIVFPVEKKIYYGVLLPIPLIIWLSFEFTDYSLFDHPFGVREVDFTTRILNIFAVYILAAGIVWRYARLNAISERRMAYSDKMASLGQIVAGLSHEINNPLQVISGTTQRLRREMSRGQEIKDLDSKLERIERSTKRIEGIMKSILHFSRDSEEDPFKPYDIKSVLQSSIELCANKASTHGVDIEFVQHESVEAEIRESEIMQVVLNLISNSIDAVANLDKKWVRVNYSSDSENVTVKITDSGSGIPVKVARQIMQPFFSTKEAGQGTGLGLSISAELVKRHSGELYYNQHSDNTQFIVNLPIIQSASVSKSAGMSI